jgi:alpha-beta hydrolase superfamily lysophospholipase
MIDPALLDKIAWIGAEYVKPPIAGIVLRFPGLGGGFTKWDPDSNDLEWGEAGALTVSPFQDPWGWMNPSVLHFTDDLVEAIRLHHQLGPEVPLLSTGGSMGGHAALLYSAKSRHRVAACMATCPVCDLPYHYSERIELPRTMHHAFGSYEDITAQLIEHSPLHQVEALPDIPYLLVHGEKDQAVKKSAHSDPMVAAMRARHLRVDYVELPKMGHGSPMDYQTSHKIIDFVISNLKRTN